MKIISSCTKIELELIQELKKMKLISQQSFLSMKGMINSGNYQALDCIRNFIKKSKYITYLDYSLCSCGGLLIRYMINELNENEFIQLI